MVSSFDVEGGKATEEVEGGSSATAIWANSTEIVSCADGCKRFWGPKQMVGAVLCPIFVVAFLLIEAAQLAFLTDQQTRLLGVLFLVVTLWLCEVIPIPATALLIGPLMVLFQVVPTWQGALQWYSHDVAFLLGGSFTLTAAVQYHSLDKYIAEAIKEMPCVRGNRLLLRAAVVVAAGIVSLILNAPAVTAMFLPILMELAGAKQGVPLGDQGAQTWLSGSMLSVLYASLAGEFAALFKPPVVVFMAGLQGTSASGKIGFISWSMVGLPGTALVIIVGFGLMYWLQPVGIMQLDSEHAELASISVRSKSLSWGQKVTGCCCVLVMVLWVFPALYLQAGGPGAPALNNIFTSGCSAMFAAAPLLFIPDLEKGFAQAVMPWKEILKAVDLGVIFVAGGGICLGVQMSQTGLADIIANGFVNATGIHDIYMLILITTIFTIFLTEVMSNLASITILTPVILAAALRITNGDVASALWPLATIPMAASCSFMMPWASPMNLMIINSGHVTSWNMMKYGFLMNMACALIIFVDVALLAPQVWPQDSIRLEPVTEQLPTSALSVFRFANETTVVV